MKRAWTWAKATSLAAVVTILTACGGGGSDAPPPVHGSCGAERNICLAGTFNDVLDGDTEYRWDCNGLNGGNTAMCSLPKPVDGACGEEANVCLRGDLDDILDSDTNNLWNCDGRHGGTVAMCSLPKPVDGICGEEINMCLGGDLNDILDSDGEFRWDCDGKHGGNTAMCALPKPVDGECGAEVNMCVSGNLDDILDTDTDNLWNCDGLHGGQPAMCSLTKLVVCPNGAPAADNPLLCERGNVGAMIAGIDRLPLDRVQLTNEQVQQHFAIVEVTTNHAKWVGITACGSYVTASEGCEDHANRAGTTWYPEGDVVVRHGLTPFTQILILYRGGQDDDLLLWEFEQVAAMHDLRILNISARPSSLHFGDADTPYLQIRSAGNLGSNHSWFLDDYGSFLQDLFTRAIAANKVLIVAGHDRNANGDYIRHAGSASCKDVDYGCLWTPYEFTIGAHFPVAGTSLSAPNIAASLASVISIFPDTSHQNLAKLARACAKKTGEGIDGAHGLLATSGGFGVADFSCMDEITAASADLSGSETATLTIDGRQVVVSPRSITVTEP